MKVLHVAQSLDNGGASVATGRIHAALIQNNVSSHVFVETMPDGMANVSAPLKWHDRLKRRSIRFASKFVFDRMLGAASKYFSSGLLPSPWLKYINEYECDVVHLHWLGRELLSYDQIAKINKPVVVTMHDYWMLGYGFHLNHSEIPRRRFSRFLMRYLLGVISKKRQKMLATRKLALVAPSELLQKAVQSDPNFCHAHVETIPHPLSSISHAIREKNEAREALSLSRTDKFLLFAVDPRNEDSNKGFGLVRSFANQFYETLAEKRIRIVVLGKPLNPSEADNDRFIFLGKVNSQSVLGDIYCACDAVLVPSLFEAFGLVAQEAIAYGTPVVASKQLGISDFITEGKTGFQFTQNDETSLLAAVLKTFDLPAFKAAPYIKQFSNDAVARRYVNIYQRLLISE